MKKNDVKSYQITVSLSTKLFLIRKKLAEDDLFGVPIGRQRLFFMGRELKNSGRSLAGLGLGAFNNHVLHLHARPDANAADGGGPVRKRRRIISSQLQTRLQSAGSTGSTNVRTSRSNHNRDVVELLDSDSESEDDDQVQIIEQPANAAARQYQDHVVEMLDSDSDDDDDDDEDNDEQVRVQEDVCDSDEDGAEGKVLEIEQNAKKWQS